MRRGSDASVNGKSKSEDTSAEAGNALGEVDLLAKIFRAAPAGHVPQILSWQPKPDDLLSHPASLSRSASDVRGKSFLLKSSRILGIPGHRHHPKHVKSPWPMLKSGRSFQKGRLALGSVLRSEDHSFSSRLVALHFRLLAAEAEGVGITQNVEALSLAHKMRPSHERIFFLLREGTLAVRSGNASRRFKADPPPPHASAVLCL